MILSDYVVAFIRNNGVQHIFELTGGAVTNLLDSVYRHPELTCVSVHHEQAAAFAAEAYARINGRLGVAMATSGPGALNLLTGIGSCYFDSVPCLFITGQVNTYEYKYDRPLRQVGFQETDIVSIVQPIVKYCHLVDRPETIRYHLEKAVYLAQTGRPGPVLLDIPMDIQRAEINPADLTGFMESAEGLQVRAAEPQCSPETVAKVAALISSAARPVILAGGGVRAAGAARLLTELVRYTGIPVVTSLLGLDAVPHQPDSFCGMIGIYANRYSNLTIANCDLALILGSRLDSRQTGTKPLTFARAAQKVQVDIDPVEFNSKVPVDLAVNCHLYDFLSRLNDRLRKSPPPDLAEWYQQIKHFKTEISARDAKEAKIRNYPNYMMELLSLCSDGNAVIILDVGQNQMWAAQSFLLQPEQRLLISGGMGAMGFGVAAAVGAALAAPERQVIVITGDGGLQINIQEMDTICARRLPVKIFVFNNHCLGMVRQFQDCYFEGRRQSTLWGYHCPDLNRVAAAYGFPTFTVVCGADAVPIFEQALETDGPTFTNIELSQETLVDPKLLVNQPLEDMAPFLSREELQRLMVIDLLKPESKSK